ncbi:MAG TPA: DUF4389 domain-containing protein [Gemmatimonadaceae bacterium]
MTSAAAPITAHAPHPVHVHIEPALGDRNRLSVAFRLILALPHLLLVGAPVALTLTWSRTTDGLANNDWTMGGGVLGAVAVVCALIAWFAILFTGRYPEGLRALVTYYLRWRVRASAYMALLRDEYPPFGEALYPAELAVDALPNEHNRLSVAFRPILLIPQVIVVWLLGIAWWFITIVAWLAILFTGQYPSAMYRFAVGVLQWTTRVEAYALLLHDEYPPFGFHD